MGGTVTGADLARDWSLSFADFELVNARPVSARLGLAVQLKFYALRGYFIENGADVPGEAVSWLAEQLGVGDTDLSSPDVSGRSGRRHRAAILQHLGLRRMTRADRGALSGWIATELCPGDPAVGAMMDRVFLWCLDARIFGPSRKEMERVVRSERQRFLEVGLARVVDRLSPDAVARMEVSLAEPDGATGFHSIKADTGQASLDNIIAAADRLAFIRSLNLPADLLSFAGKAWVERIVRRVGAEKASEMRRHAPQRQLGLYAVFLKAREARIVDGLVDLGAGVTHETGW